MPSHITNDVIKHIAPHEVILPAWNDMVKGLQGCTQNTRKAE